MVQRHARLRCRALEDCGEQESEQLTSESACGGASPSFLRFRIFMGAGTAPLVEGLGVSGA